MGRRVKRRDGAAPVRTSTKGRRAAPVVTGVSARSLCRESNIERFSSSPTLVELFYDKSFVRGVVGPVGSGKTYANCSELGHWAYDQAPATNNVKYTRFAIVRNSYPMLDTTTIPTWKEIYPEDIFGPVVGSRLPRVHHIRIPPEGPTVGVDEAGIDMEVHFFSLDDEKATEKLLSTQYTAVFLHEAQLIDKKIVDHVTGRVGRYPLGDRGTCSRSGVLFDCNPPPGNHWIPDSETAPDLTGENVAEELRWKIFRQPAAAFKMTAQEAEALDEDNLPREVVRSGTDYWKINPDRENSAYVGDDYYRKILPGKTLNYLNVYVGAQYGHVYAGQPIWPEYSQKMEVKGLVADPEQPILYGIDFGRKPACVFGQLMPNRQWRIIDELLGTDTDTVSFTNHIRQYAMINYPAHANSPSLFRGFCDPAGTNKNMDYSTTSLQIANSNGLNVWPAPSNNQMTRRDASAQPMLRWVDDEPGLLVDVQACPRLVEALRGGYQFKKDTRGGVRAETFLKDDTHSHVGDAFQYLTLGGGEHTGMMIGGAEAPQPMQATSYVEDYDPFGN